MKVYLKKLLLASFISSAQLAVTAHGAGNQFYEGNADGWFWYQDPIVEAEKPPKEKEPKKEEQPQVIVMEAPKDTPEPMDPVASPKGPTPLSNEWFRENLQTYIDKAMDDPTPENVEAYYLLQRIAIDKAQEFTDMAQKVVVGDPILDEINRRGDDRSSTQHQELVSNQRRQKLIADISQRSGIAFFYSSECGTCGNQAVVLQNVIKRTSMELLPITTDGEPLSNGLFAEESIVDNGQAEILGVDKSNPAIFLMAPEDNKWIPVSRGSVTQESLISRILLAATREGLISDDQLDSSRSTNRTPSLAKALPKDGELPTDTKELIKYLRGLENK